MIETDHREPQESNGAAPSRFAHAWRALRHRNFRLFFSGQTISLTGTWMTRVATGWLVYRLTGSALMLGTVSFAGQIPTMLLGPVAGVWVDRLERRQLLVWTQALLMAQGFALAALALSHTITIPILIALSVLQGCVNAFDMPGRQSFMVQMVEDKRDLSNAIAINSSMVNAARLIGPSVAGMLIAATSEGWCFLVDGISYMAVIASLLLMRVAPQPARRTGRSTIDDLREGWEYVRDFLPIRVILELFAVVSLMGMPFVVLMPIFAKTVLKGGPHTLGFLMAALGCGALISALRLAARRTVVGLVRMIPVAGVLFGLSLISFGLSRNFWLSLLFVGLAGMGMMMGMAGSNTVIQTIVSEDKRGRVMSYYTMAFMGMAPFGSLLAGAMAHAIGAPWTVVANGSCVVVAAILFSFRLPAVGRILRPIYREMGILPDAETLSTIPTEE